MRVRFLAASLFLATAPLFAGTLSYVNESAAAERRLVLRREGAQLLIADADSHQTLAIAPAVTTERVIVQGAAGTHDDMLTVDLAQPISLAAGIDFDGGADGWDTLVLQDGSTRDQRVQQLSAHDGLFNLDGLILRYSNLEPITDTAPAANYAISGTGAQELVYFEDGPGGTTTVRSANNSFESVTFANKTNVVYDGGPAHDDVDFTNPNPATGLVSLIITNAGTVVQHDSIRYSSLGISAEGLISLEGYPYGNDVDRVELTSVNGTIIFGDTDDLIVGGVSPAFSGARVLQSGSVIVSSAGDLVLEDSDGVEVIRSGALSGDVGVDAFNITMPIDRDAMIAPVGSVYIQTLGKLSLGTGGANYTNDIRAATSVHITALQGIDLAGLTTIMADAFGQNSGEDLSVFFDGMVTQTEGAHFLAGGTAGAGVEILTGTGEMQFLGFSNAAESASGDVKLLGRGLAIAPTSGVAAPAGTVIIEAHGLDLGAVVDVPGSPMELSDAELDRIVAPLVRIEALSALSGIVHVTQPITFSTGAELVLMTNEYLTAEGAGSLSAPTLTFEIPSFTPVSWTITPASVRTAPGTAIPYGGVTTLNARGFTTDPQWAHPSNTNDTFDVAPSPATTINVDGYLPAPPASPGDTLDFDLTGVAAPVLTATLTPSGYQGGVTSANRQPVNFQRIEQLVDAPVDLGITKTDGVTSVIAGTAIAYTIQVTNPSPIAVTGATVTDAFSADLVNVQWTCAASAGSTCTSGSGTNLTDGVTLAPNGSLTYTVHATVSPSATTTLTNTASIVTPAGYTETDPANNSSTDTDTMTTEADLIVEKTSNRGTADPGDDITYTIGLRNAGPSTAQTVSLSDVLPANTTFVSLTAAPGYSCTTPPAGANGTITCTLASLLPAATADVFTLILHVSPAAVKGSTITNTATATSATSDPTPANTDSAAVVLIAFIPTLSTTMLCVLAALLALVALRMR